MAQLPMNLQYFAEEKTEKATPKKRQESRRKGHVAKSNELPSAIIFLLMFIAFFLMGSYLSNHLLQLYEKVLHQHLLWDASPENIRLLFIEIIYDVIWVIIPIFGIAIIGALTGNLIQVGFLVSGEPLKFKLERLNPIEGAKKIFSKRAIVELLKSLLKISLVGYIAYSALWNKKDTLFALYHYDLFEIMSFVSKLLLEIGIKVSILLIFIAILDYVYQKYDYEKNIRMSKKDIKDEYKRTEGDPLIKSKIKERQRQMAMRRMMQAVPEADVIITNPTHYAVAITYKTEQMDAPTVVAKGMDHVALKIKEVATEHDVAVIENKWLARTLYYQVEIGDAIPEALYQAVAEVLAYVYKLKGYVTT